MEAKTVLMNGKVLSENWGKAISAVFSSSPRIETHRGVCETLAKVLPKANFPDDGKIEIRWGSYKQFSTVANLKLGVQFGMGITTQKEGKEVADLETSLMAEIAK